VRPAENFATEFVKTLRRGGYSLGQKAIDLLTTSPIPQSAEIAVTNEAELIKKSA